MDNFIKRQYRVISDDEEIQAIYIAQQAILEIPETDRVQAARRIARYLKAYWDDQDYFWKKDD